MAARLSIVAATNRPHSIDAALRRPGRFDCELAVSTPGPQVCCSTIEIRHAQGLSLAYVSLACSHSLDSNVFHQSNGIPAILCSCQQHAWLIPGSEPWGLKRSTRLVSCLPWCEMSRFWGPHIRRSEPWIQLKCFEINCMVIEETPASLLSDACRFDAGPDANA